MSDRFKIHNKKAVYLRRDVQGTITGLVNQNDSIVEEYSYDACLSRCSREGRRRNPTDWTYDSVPQPQYLYRGYTMHVLRNTDCGSVANRNPNVEQIPILYHFYYFGVDYIGKMLDEFGLINMPARRNGNEGGNGRCGVYPDEIGNPVVGRFLSPDIIVQNPNNTQCYNRYSYCINNPLKYSDPSGWVYDQSWTHRHNANVVNHNLLDRLWGHNWTFDEKEEWNALIEATGGNSLNNAGELVDLLGIYANNLKMDNNLSIFNNSFFTIYVDPEIENKYTNLVKEGKYKEAVTLVIRSYELDKNMLNSGVDIDNLYSIKTHSDMDRINITTGKVGYKQHETIDFSELSLKSCSFGTIVRTIYHELIHVYEGSILLMEDHGERELLAHYYTFYPTKNLPEATNGQYILWKNDALDHYGQIPWRTIYDRKRWTLNFNRIGGIIVY